MVIIAGYNDWKTQKWQWCGGTPSPCSSLLFLRASIPSKNCSMSLFDTTCKQLTSPQILILVAMTTQWLTFFSFSKSCKNSTSSDLSSLNSGERGGRVEWKANLPHGCACLRWKASTWCTRSNWEERAAMPASRMVGRVWALASYAATVSSSSRRKWVWVVA